MFRPSATVARAERCGCLGGDSAFTGDGSRVFVPKWRIRGGACERKGGTVLP